MQDALHLLHRLVAADRLVEPSGGQGGVDHQRATRRASCVGRRLHVCSCARSCGSQEIQALAQVRRRTPVAGRRTSALVRGGVRRAWCAMLWILSNLSVTIASMISAASSRSAVVGRREDVCAPIVSMISAPSSLEDASRRRSGTRRTRCGRPAACDIFVLRRGSFIKTRRKVPSICSSSDFLHARSTQLPLRRAVQIQVR